MPGPTTTFKESMLKLLLSFRIRPRREERKGGGGKIRTVRSLVGHGMPFDWIAGPTKSRDSVYLILTGKSLWKLAAPGMCLGPKDPGEHIDQFNYHDHVGLHEAEQKEKD
jgi:hypothetical protein